MAAHSSRMRSQKNNHKVSPTVFGFRSRMNECGKFTTNGYSHQMIEAFLLLVRQRIPGGRFSSAWAERPPCVNQSHFDLPAVTLFAQPVPTGFIFPAIFGNQFLRRHQREMRRVVRKVKKEGLVSFPRLVNELLLRNICGSVTTFGALAMIRTPTSIPIESGDSAPRCS